MRNSFSGLGVALAVILAGSTVAGAASEFQFDMGTAQSPVWPGCRRVSKETTYTPKRGYGWQTRSKLYDCHRTAWHDKGSKLSIPDDLWGDFVFSRGTNAFHVDLPKGRYEVVLLIGDMGSVYGPHTTAVRSLYPASSVIIKANGKEFIKEIVNEDNILDLWYQNEETEYRRGDCP